MLLLQNMRKKISLLENLRKSNLACTSCGACSNVCPLKAITMKPDELGFLQPEINHKKCVACHRCEEICPPLNKKENNDRNPQCLAAMASEKERVESSSGAIFPVLAKYILMQGGAVVGAAFTEDFRDVDMILIEHEDQLQKLRGSKYVQSRANSIYSEVMCLLKEGRKVLFSGLPCQVAAMKNIAGKENKNLLLVDILCANAGAPNMYHMYLDEIAKGRSIKKIDFKSKRVEWKHPTMEIEFEDGSYYRRDAYREDPYVRGFVSHLYGKESCTKCPFQEMPRQGDISVGDCWGIEQCYPEWDYSAGVSVVLLNNEKGGQLFEAVKKTLECRGISLSFLKSHNRVQRNVPNHLGRGRFLEELLPAMSFSKAVDMALGWKFDVAITGMWLVRNYGGSLTYYALYHLLLDMGYHPIMVESCDLAKEVTPKSTCFREQPYPFYNVSRIHNDLRQMEELNNRVGAFILGSDQTWNPRLFKKETPSYWLVYVQPWRKRIAYAASFGATKYLGDTRIRALFGEEIRKFDDISVREKSGVSICRDTFGVSAVHVVDPVFLCDPMHYETLAKKSELRFLKKTVVAYIMWPDGHVETRETLESFAKTFDAEYLVIGDKLDAASRMEEARNNRPGTAMYDYTLNVYSEDWIYAIKSAEYIITDSFHAVAFAIVFKKNFLFKTEAHASFESGLERLTSLLEPLGLLMHMVPKHISAIEYIRMHPELKRPIDYDTVYKKMESMKAESMVWLRKAIERNKWETEQRDI